MKTRKFLPLTMLSMLCLTSCGSTNVYGTYKFTLGRQGDDQVRVGVSMQLTNEKVEVDYVDDKGETQKKNYEKFIFDIDLGSMMDELAGSLITDFELTEEELDEIEIPESIEGYYEVLNDVDEKYGNKMAIGFSLGKDYPIQIPNDLIRNLMVTYVNEKAITLQVPVSITDLQMQLAWYGYYVDFDPYIKERLHSLEDFNKFFYDILDSYKFYNLADYSELPGVKGNARFGSHPVVESSDDVSKIKDEVYMMNLEYEGLFSNSFVYKNNTCSYSDRIGTLYTHTLIESDGKIGYKYYYYPLDKEFDASHPFTAYMKGYNVEENRYIDITELAFDLAPQDNYSISHVLMGTQEIELSSDNFLQDPFEFRDFHDIKISLAKED